MNKRIIKFSILTITFSVFGLSSIIALPDEPVRSLVYESIFTKMFAAMVILTLLAALVTFIRISFMMMDQAKAKVYTDEGLEVPEVKKSDKTLYDKMMHWMTLAVPVEREADVMLNHEYDGIRELDNKLPPWWLAMFYISIIFGVFYMGYYHFSDHGKSIQEVYEQEMADAEFAQLQYLERIANKVNERTVNALTADADLKNGSRIFIQNCATCHGNLGEGGVGPNLTDQYWLHGQGSIRDVFKVVKYGVPEKGMTSWEKQMGPKQIQEVSSYIMTLKGTTPPNPKDPQGELINTTEGI